MEVGLGEVAEAAVKDDSEGDVIEGGVVGGGVAGADAALVLAEAGIAPVMVAVLDGPVATVPGEQLFGVGAVCGDGGDAIGDLLAGFGLEVGALARDAEGLWPVRCRGWCVAGRCPPPPGTKSSPTAPPTGPPCGPATPPAPATPPGSDVSRTAPSPPARSTGIAERAKQDLGGMIHYPEYTLTRPPSCPRNQDHLTDATVVAMGNAFVIGSRRVQRCPFPVDQHQRATRLRSNAPVTRCTLLWNRKWQHEVL